MDQNSIRNQLSNAARVMPKDMRRSLRAFMATLKPTPKPRKVHSWKRKKPARQKPIAQKTLL
ncbi:MAG: hypothetical protein ACRCYS_11820 [Beijerinckiaceae bacterium]